MRSATLAAGGGTSYVAGVTAANTVLSDAAAASTKTLVFLSDGADTSGGTLPAVPSGTTVRAFAIGAGSCTTGPIPMSAVAALGGPGSSCTQVTDLSVLDDVIGQQVGSTLSALAVSVDGGPAVPVPAANIVPTLPQGGPASVTWTTSVTLASGNHNICVTATGSDVGGTGTANDCIPVQVAAATVDCVAGQQCSVTTNRRRQGDRDPDNAGRHRDGRAPARGDPARRVRRRQLRDRVRRLVHDHRWSRNRRR